MPPLSSESPFRLPPRTLALMGVLFLAIVFFSEDRQRAEVAPAPARHHPYENPFLGTSRAARRADSLAQPAEEDPPAPEDAPSSSSLLASFASKFARTFEGGSRSDADDDVTVDEATLAELRLTEERAERVDEDVRDDFSEPASPLAARVPSWYDARTRYFLFQQSGGISNQLKILGWALHACRILERTCVVPPIGPHTTFFSTYNKVPLGDCAAAPVMLDVPAMRAAAPVAFLQTTLADFLHAHQDKLGGAWRTVERNRLREKIESPWAASDVASFFADEPAQFLFFSKGTMWRNFNFSEEEMEPVLRSVRFHPTLRGAARVLAERMGRYNALHIRFSDGESNKVRVDWLKPSSTFLYRMRMARFAEYSSALYIATVPSKAGHPYFGKIRAGYNVTFSSALVHSDVVQRALRPFPDAMRTIALGAIEQHVCARAHKFLGTGFSTFSAQIRIMRRYRAIAHDPDALSPSAPRAVRAAEEEFLRQVTPCVLETKPC